MLKIKAALSLGRPAGAAQPNRTIPRRGSPLPHDVRQAAEGLLEADLASVRVHVSSVPTRMLATAFTHGDDIYFAPSRYDPGTPEGLRLLGHELAHVVQQRQGRAYNRHGYGVALVRDPALEDEAERTGLALQTMMMKGKAKAKAKAEAEEPYLCLNISNWDQYWDSKTNNKYPRIEVLNLHAFDQTQKLALILSILDQRREICRFLTAPNSYSQDARQTLQGVGEAGGSAIFIPTSGKDAEWMWRRNKTQTAPQWWWMRMARAGIPVFLVVSQDEFNVYAGGLHGHGDVPLYVVGYDGFGIGCGRAACVHLLMEHRIKGVITDDRTSSTDLDTDPVETLPQFQEMIALSDEKFFCSVAPKYDCNIMTIVRGDKTIDAIDGMFCFPSLLMSSKEDLCLAAIMEKRIPGFCANDQIYRITVHTDTNNPPYKNTSVAYTGRKAIVLEMCCASRFFRDAAGKPMTAQRWHKEYKFLNMWDVIKMQESALYQLIESLGGIEAKNDAGLQAIVNNYFLARR